MSNERNNTNAKENTMKANPIAPAWNATKDMYNTLPAAIRESITREQWDNVMPWVMTTAAKAVKDTGADPVDAMMSAFAEFADFLAELHDGRTDNAKAMRTSIRDSVYAAAN